MSVYDWICVAGHLQGTELFFSSVTIPWELTVFFVAPFCCVGCFFFFFFWEEKGEWALPFVRLSLTVKDLLLLIGL